MQYAPPQEEPKKDRGCLTGWYVLLTYDKNIITDESVWWPCAAASCARKLANAALNVPSVYVVVVDLIYVYTILDISQ